MESKTKPPQQEGSEKMKIEENRKWLLENFIKLLLEQLGSYQTEEEGDYEEWLRVPPRERMTLTLDFPAYQQKQACYGVNRFIEGTCKVKRRVAYQGGELVPPQFEEIELKRGHWETLQVDGSIFFTWRAMRIIGRIQFKTYSPYVHFFFRKKDLKKMKEFQALLRRFIEEENYLKGEKLELLPGSRVTYLKYPKLEWRDLILEDEVRETIELNLVFSILNRERCEQAKIPWRRGVLVAGVPGTGKTLLGKVLCNTLEEVTVIWATAKALRETGEVKNLFRIARELKPTLLILEDIDFFGYDRELINNPLVGELLNQLDGSTPNEGIFVLASTNRPHLLDKALANRPSRFDVRLIFEPPKYPERLRMVKLFTEGKALDVEEKFIAEITDSLTGAHIKELINSSALLALREGRGRIGKDHLTRTLRRMKSNLEETKILVS